MAYTPTYTKPYPDGWQNLPEETTPITAEVLDKIDEAIAAIEKQLKTTTENYESSPPQIKFGMSDKTKSSPCSIIGGQSNTVSGYNNIVGGGSNTVSGNAGITGGSGNTNKGQNSLVAGSQNTDSGYYNITSGQYNENKGYDTGLFGYYLKSVSNNYTAHLVCGSYNDPDEILKNASGRQEGDILLEVGNGKNDSSRSNALLLDSAGNLSIKGSLYTKSGKLPEVIPGFAQFESMGYMASNLNNASNTAYSIGTVLRITGRDGYDFYISKINETSVIGDTNVESALRSGGGSAQFGYYTVIPVKAVSDNLFYTSGVESLVNLFNTSKCFAIGNIIRVPDPSFPVLFIMQKNSTASKYTYTSASDIISKLRQNQSMTIGYYTVCPLIPYGNPGFDGLFKPDGSTIQYEEGVISARQASMDQTGYVKPDGTSTIVDEDGTIHAMLEGALVDYSNAVNKPSINDVELEGNKSFDDLGLTPLTNTEILAIINKASN